MFKELWWLIKKLFTKIEESEGLTYKEMKHFPFKGYSAMCWCGYLILRKDSKTTTKTLVHENIHLRQAIEKYKGKRWIRFYTNYFWWYLKGFTLLNPMSSAYYTIPYEMEAYAHQHEKSYIKKITKDSYKKYIIKHRRTTYKKYRDNWINYLKSI